MSRTVFSINQIYLLGVVTRDPEHRVTQSGVDVLTFSLVTNHSIKKGESYEDEPTFHNIVVWQHAAKYLSGKLKKGDKVIVDGRVQNRSYEANDGSKRYVSEVIANAVTPFLKASEIKAPAKTQEYDSYDDTIPF